MLKVDRTVAFGAFANVQLAGVEAAARAAAANAAAQAAAHQREPVQVEVIVRVAPQKGKP